MRSFLPLLLAVTGVMGFAAFSGCGGEENIGPKNEVTSVTVTAGSGLTPCNGQPDGACNALGANPEGCDCSDCFTTALCMSLCTDDGTCAYAPETGEDCSCADCAFKIFECSGTPNCDDNGDPEEGIPNTCTLADSCTCSECIDVPECNDCFDNGSCSPANEGCNCADCAGHELCNGGTAAVTSSSSAGGGGEGGMGGGSTTASTTASTTVATTASATTTAATTGGGGNGGSGGN